MPATLPWSLRAMIPAAQIERDIVVGHTLTVNKCWVSNDSLQATGKCWIVESLCYVVLSLFAFLLIFAGLTIAEPHAYFSLTWISLVLSFQNRSLQNHHNLQMQSLVRWKGLKHVQMIDKSWGRFMKISDESVDENVACICSVELCSCTALERQNIWYAQIIFFCK